MLSIVWRIVPVTETCYGLEAELASQGINQLTLGDDPHLFQHLSQPLPLSPLALQSPFQGFFTDQFGLHQDIAQLLFLSYIGKGAVLA
jgi:hypothetical protein